MLMNKMTVRTFTGPEAVGIIGSIFRARRDLSLLVKRQVIKGMGVSLEEADLLYDLYGAAKLGWQDPKAIKAGWVTFGALQDSLVHARELLTRRLGDLVASGYVEIAPVGKEEARELGIDAKSKKARNLPKGEEKAKEIHDRYCKVCLQVINKLPAEVQQHAENVHKFNLAIINELRWGI
jgi:hypothetical protein